MNLWHLYWDDIPRIIRDGMQGDEMERLRHVGMNCGCEYTSFPLFRSMRDRYTRYEHSVGTALITWRFTRDPAQALAALFHDVATPCFAHVIDFMCGDYLRQESTEERTREFIERSEYLQDVLKRYGLATDDVADYHRYPVADNDSPRLSADRLEYTCGNLVNYGRLPEADIGNLLDDLTVGRNEDGEEELAFRTQEKALRFARGALETGRIYVSDEDRFAMQALALLLKEAVRSGALTAEDLRTDEPSVIRKLCADPVMRTRWETFRCYRRIIRGGKDGLVIPAKKRYINPMVNGRGRLTALDPDFSSEVRIFLNEPQDIPLTGVPDDEPRFSEKLREEGFLEIRVDDYYDLLMEQQEQM